MGENPRFPDTVSAGSGNPFTAGCLRASTVTESRISIGANIDCAGAWETMGRRAYGRQSMNEDRSDAIAADPRSDLVDLSGVTLTQLANLPQNALTESLRRVLTDRAAQPTMFAQFHAII